MNNYKDLDQIGRQALTVSLNFMNKYVIHLMRFKLSNNISMMAK